MKQPIVVVDAFTDRPFAGNPAAVCQLEREADERWMQSVAAEMNLSETAFLRRDADGFRLRWFTPAAEVALCGHATLASAHHLWESGSLPPTAPARFHTKSGLLTAVRRGEWIEMDFPGKPETPEAAAPELMRAIGAAATYVGASQFDCLVELGSESEVRSLAPDINLLTTLPWRGVIVTTRSVTPGYDFISRFFAPKVGVREDPVTGSAHCVLGPYWKKRLGKDDFTAYQASPRGGVVRVGVRGDRVLLGGQAVTVWRGDLV
jgi:predicted PhzF superfamily epimerase YddE/YHI9